VPFRKEDEPWWDERDIPEDEPEDRPVPPEPVELREGLHTADRPEVDREVPCGCGCCAVPDSPEPVEALAAATREHVRDTELAFTFGRQWALAQQHTAAAWQAAALMYSRALAERGTAGAEHVGSDLALLMNVHPRTGETVMLTAIGACLQVPELGALVLAGELTVKHVDALLRAAQQWTDDPDTAAHVIGLTLDGCRARLDRYGWPTPTELKKRLAKVAILHDLQALTRQRKNVADGRGVSLWQSGVGKATLTIEGPELMLLQAYRAIETRAHAMARLPGDQRSLQQRLHDAALELLCVDADGGVSAVPSTGLDGEPVTITVRGVQIVVLVPYSVLTGGDLELAEIDGYGPLLPATARELAEQAQTFRRVAIDADSGHVITVDDAVPTRRRPRPAEPTPVVDPAADPAADLDDNRDHPSDHPSDQTTEQDPDDDSPGDDGPGDDGPGDDSPGDDSPGDDPGDDGPGGDGGSGPDAPPAPPSNPATTGGLALNRDEPGMPAPEPLAAARVEDASAGAALNEQTQALLTRLVAQPVTLVDLSSTRYRVPGRLRRKLILRDRTCTFPGCTVPGRYVDIDHRDDWPRGATDEANCHCLCRKHHRAKQAYFNVKLDTFSGDTCWVTPDGREYRRPPPTF
jgi:hypothetical protein